MPNLFSRSSTTTKNVLLLKKKVKQVNQNHTATKWKTRSSDGKMWQWEGEKKKKKTLNSVKRVNIDKIPQHHKNFSVYFHCTIAGWNMKFHKLIKMHYKFQFLFRVLKKPLFDMCVLEISRGECFFIVCHTMKTDNASYWAPNI